MRINNLILHNFSSFEGINEFDFRLEDGKNIILIGGQNGAGKTSLFTAIKVALYGSLAFGYIGANAHYTARIKEFINTNAYQEETVKSSVRINISLKVEREIQEYEIVRSWSYSNKKLEEEFYVLTNGEVLDGKELSYFQNYLLNIIPPDLFDFFLFDGEEVSNIFSNNKYNRYVKNALFTMCDMDLYETVRKHTSGYIAKNSVDTIDQDAYEEIKEEVNALRNTIEKLETKRENLEKASDEINIQLEELEVAYKNAGGITVEEREGLISQFNNAEKVKQENSLKMKTFIEGLMPFYIVGNYSESILSQLNMEEKRNTFNYVQGKLTEASLKTAIVKAGNISETCIDDIIEVLIETFKPDEENLTAESIHDLSKEEITKVNTIISQINSFDREAMIRLIEEKAMAANTTANINKQLKNSMADEDVQLFKSKENELLKEKESLVRALYEVEGELLKCRDSLDHKEKQCDAKYQDLISKTQNKRIYELSSGIAQIMQSLLHNKTTDIKNRLEKDIVENLSNIYRKDNLITHIEVADDFQFNLYQDALYYEGELLALINNLGNDATQILIGHKGITEIFKKYNVNTMYGLKKALQKSSYMMPIYTYKRIDLNRLSKGERQIFILALYWAIINISGRSIPFVIDTPYARIDANHRREISEKFFPNISDQVIILSTDEEITEEYYNIIHPFVSKEYLLINNENENKTIVEERYFFEVAR